MNKKEEEEETKGIEEKNNEKSNEKDKLMDYKECKDNKQLNEILYQMFKEYKDGKGTKQRYNSKDNICTKYQEHIEKIGIHYPIHQLKNLISNLNRKDYLQGVEFNDRYEKENKNAEGNPDNQSDQHQKTKNWPQSQLIHSNSSFFPTSQLQPLQGQIRSGSFRVDRVMSSPSDIPPILFGKNLTQPANYRNNSMISFHPPQGQPSFYILNTYYKPTVGQTVRFSDDKNNTGKNANQQDDQQQRNQNQQSNRLIKSNPPVLPILQAQPMQTQISKSAQNQNFIDHNYSENKLDRVEPSSIYAGKNQTQTNTQPNDSMNFSQHQSYLNSVSMPMPQVALALNQNSDVSDDMRKTKKQHIKSNFVQKDKQNYEADVINNNGQDQTKDQHESTNLNAELNDADSSEDDCLPIQSYDDESQTANSSIEKRDSNQSIQLDSANQILEQAYGISRNPSSKSDTYDPEGADISRSTSSKSDSYDPEMPIQNKFESKSTKFPLLQPPKNYPFTNEFQTNSTSQIQPELPHNFNQFQTILHQQKEDFLIPKILVNNDPIQINLPNALNENKKESNTFSIGKTKSYKLSLSSSSPIDIFPIQQAQSPNDSFQLHTAADEKSNEQTSNYYSIEKTKSKQTSSSSEIQINKTKNQKIIRTSSSEYNEELYEKSTNMQLLSKATDEADDDDPQLPSSNPKIRPNLQYSVDIIKGLIAQLPNINNLNDKEINSNELYNKIYLCYELIHKSFDFYNTNKYKMNENGPIIFNENLFNFQIEVEKSFKTLIYLFNEFLNIKHIYSLHDNLCERIINKSKNQPNTNTKNKNDTNNENENENIRANSHVSNLIKNLNLKEKLSLFYQGKFNKESHYSYKLNDIESYTIISYYSKQTNKSINELAYVKFNEIEKFHSLHLRGISVETGFYLPVSSMHFHHDDIQNTSKLYLFGDIRVKEFTIDGLDVIDEEITIYNSNTFYFGEYCIVSSVLTVWDDELILGANYQNETDNKACVNIWENSDDFICSNKELIEDCESIFKHDEIDFDKVEMTPGKLCKIDSIQLPNNSKQISSFAVLKNNSYKESFLAISFIDYAIIYIYDKNHVNISRLASHTMGVTCMTSFDYNLFSGSMDSTVRMWNVNRGAPELILGIENQHITCTEVAFFENKHFLFTGCNDNTVHCFSITDKKHLFEFILNHNFVPDKISFISENVEQIVNHGKLVIVSKDTKYHVCNNNVYNYQIQYFEF